MAATRLIAMHGNKGKTIAQCLKDRTDYAKNADKTENGQYVSSYACNIDIVDKEFAASKDEYFRNTRRINPGDIIACLPFILVHIYVRVARRMSVQRGLGCIPPTSK